MRFFGALVFLILACVCAQAQTFTCKIDRIHQCRIEGCVPRESTAYREFDATAKRYSRCNWEGCENHDAEFVDAGIYWNILVRSEMLVAKVNKDGSGFVETMLFDPMGFVTFATCTAKE